MIAIILCLLASLKSTTGIENNISPETLAIIQQFNTYPQADGAMNHLYNLTSRPHRAGQFLQYNVTTQYLLDVYASYGISAVAQEFTSLLNDPISRSVELLTPFYFNCTLKEPAIPEDPTSGDPESVMTFNGFGASGDVTAELVYVNYGTVSDWNTLAGMGIDITGKIAIVRYGGLFRGVKVQQAQMRGAVGVIIYSDPADDGANQGNVYPNGPWRPEQSVQRGSVEYLPICPGDPRRTEMCFGVDDPSLTASLMPGIPAQPMSYADAYPLLSNLQGPLVPQEWQGGLNFTYRVGGPGSSVVRLRVQNDFKVGTLKNVIATIPGSEAPNEIVFLGNHIDAWAFGAADPNSGTAALLETARGFGELLKTGWRPKRTIKIGFWDGEEYGLIGSTYYAEEAPPTELAKVVTYINVDTAVTGRLFSASGSASLLSFMRYITTLLIDPFTGNTLYQQWLVNFGAQLGVLGSGSDFTAFLHHFGVPCVDFGFGGNYGVYHSIYDSFTWMTQFGDPGFIYHQFSAQLAGTLAIALSDSAVVPLTYTDTASALQSYLQTTINSLAPYNPSPVDLTPLAEAISTFNYSAIHASIEVLRAVDSKESVKKAQSVNSWLYSIERQFLDTTGLPSRPWYKHVLQAPGINLGYGSQVFPGLAQAIDQQNWTLAAEQVTAIAARINAAAAQLDTYSDTTTDPRREDVIIALSVIFSVLGVAIIIYFCYRRCGPCCGSKKRGIIDDHTGQYDSLDEVSTR